MGQSNRYTDRQDSIFRTTVLTILYFLFLYPFQVPGLPFGTVIPVIGLLAIISIFSFGRKNNNKLSSSKMVKNYWWWTIFLIVYISLLLSSNGSGNGSTPIRDYVNMLLILPIFYISGIFLCRDIEDLMRLLYIGVIIQSIIIIAALFLPSLSLALFLLIPEGGYNSDNFGGIDMIDQVGYHVGLGVFTSAGSLKMAIGQVGAAYFLIKNRGIKLSFHLVVYMLITIATSLVSRTGLLVSVVGLLTVLTVKNKQNRQRAFGYVSSVIIILILGGIVATTFFSMDLLEDSFKRLSDTAERGIFDTYFRGYIGEGGDNNIPPISVETIIGLGITYGTSGSGITTITDGGFMRNYSAMGLVVAIINYVIIAFFFIKRYNATISVEYKGIILFMAAIILIGEFKEYYIYYISPMCFLFLIFGLIERSERTSLITIGGSFTIVR